MTPLSAEDRDRIFEVAQGISTGARWFQQVRLEMGQPIRDDILLSGMLTLAASMMRGAPADWRKDALQQFILACEPLPVRHDA